MLQAERPKRNETILLADDDAEDRMRMRRYLESEGYRVLEASGGSMALELALTSAEAIDMLITDVRMPELSGMELAKRALALRPHLRVLYVSGFSLEILGLLKMPLEQGSLINKSVDKGTFLEKVRYRLSYVPQV